MSRLVFYRWDIMLSLCLFQTAGFLVTVFPYVRLNGVGTFRTHQFTFNPSLIHMLFWLINRWHSKGKGRVQCKDKKSKRVCEPGKVHLTIRGQTDGVSLKKGVNPPCIPTLTIMGLTVQITFIFIGQTRLVFGNRVCTCVTKHSNAFRTFLNWLNGLFWIGLMARSFEVVNFVFTSSRVVKTVHLDLHTGTFPYTRLVNWGMNFWFYLHQ